MGLLVLLFVATFFVDLSLLTRVARAIGPGPTLGFVVAMGLLGIALARNQGRRVLREWQAALNQGRVPQQGIVSGILVLLGALLLIVPGILTDFVGLFLLMPWTRNPIELLVLGYLSRRASGGRVHVYGKPSNGPNSPTEVGRAVYRPEDVIDTEGEEVDE